MKFRCFAMAGALMFAITAPHSAMAASVITFDEFPALNDNGRLPELRYSYLGVAFVGTDDGSTWGGLAAGDPGNWDLQGTNGSTFAGFNGSSYGVDLIFSNNQTNFALDAARASGSIDGTIIIEAYLNGVLQGSDSVSLGAINTWSTLAFSGAYNQINIRGIGTQFHPFGIDNIRFDDVGSAVPEPGTWATMLLGFGLIGSAMRYRRRPKVTVRYA